MLAVRNEPRSRAGGLPSSLTFITPSTEAPIPSSVRAVDQARRSAVDRPASRPWASRSAEIEQAVRLLERHVAYQRRVDDGEDRVVEADGKAEREHYRGSKTALPGQEPQCKPDVVLDVLQPAPAPLIAGIVSGQRDIPEPASSQALGISGAQPIALQTFPGELMMELELLGDLVVNAIAPRQDEQPPHQSSRSHRLTMGVSIRGAQMSTAAPGANGAEGSDGRQFDCEAAAGSRRNVAERPRRAARATGS